MGMDIQQLSFKDGEIPVNPLVAPGGAGDNTPWFGGQPATLNATGQAILAKDGATTKWLGVFKNASVEDTANGNTTIVHGASKVVFFNGSNQIDDEDSSGSIVEGTPYDDTLTYAAGEYLYIQASGLWTNVVTGPPRGIITQAPTAQSGNMAAYLFSVA